MDFEAFLDATDEKEVMGCIKMKQNNIQIYFEGMLMHMLIDHKAHIGIVNGLTDDIDLGDLPKSEELKKRIPNSVEYNDLGLIESYDVNFHKEDEAYTLENEQTLIVFYISE